MLEDSKPFQVAFELINADYFVSPITKANLASFGIPVSLRCRDTIPSWSCARPSLIFSCSQPSTKKSRIILMSRGESVRNLSMISKCRKEVRKNGVRSSIVLNLRCSLTWLLNSTYQLRLLLGEYTGFKASNLSLPKPLVEYLSFTIFCRVVKKPLLRANGMLCPMTYNLAISHYIESRRNF